MSTNFIPTKPGVYTIAATYSGDPNYLPSTSSVSVTVNALPTPGIYINSASQGLVSTPMTFALSVSDSKGKPIASTAAIILTSTIDGAAGPSTTVSGPAANAMLTFTKPGVYTLIATFAGDSNFGPANSQNFGTTTEVTIYAPATLPTFTLTPVDPTLTATGTPLQVTSPGSAVRFLLTPLNGSGGGVTITTSAVAASGKWFLEA